MARKSTRVKKELERYTPSHTTNADKCKKYQMNKKIKEKFCKWKQDQNSRAPKDVESAQTAKASKQKNVKMASDKSVKAMK